MISLYIHVPFCIGKCHYCGFYSTVYSVRQADDYIAALGLEAARHQHAFSLRTFESVYLGGGTPTVLSSAQLKKLIGIIREYFQIAREAEFTVEANPNTVSGNTLVLLREEGINRLSLGIQSFSDEVLKTLGRLHDAEQAAEAFKQARIAGFTNIGIDLIYGVPGQTAADWNETLEKAVILEPDHISTYCLSLDEGSRLTQESKAGRFALLEDEHSADYYEHAVEYLHKAGYSRYEISNFCLPGFACRHNVNYWERGEYLGLGPGSWSFLEGRRSSTVSDAQEYSRRLQEGLPVIEEDEIAGPREAANESVMLSLRTAQGLDLVRFGLSFGNDALRRLEKNAAPLKRAGLIEVAQGKIRFTTRGFLLANESLARLAL